MVVIDHQSCIFTSYRAMHSPSYDHETDKDYQLMVKEEERVIEEFQKLYPVPLSSIAPAAKAASPKPKRAAAASSLPKSSLPKSSSSASESVRGRKKKIE